SLAGLSRELSDLAAKAKKEGDSAALLSASRAASSVLIQLARLTPPPIEESGLMLVNAAEMQSAADHCRTKVFDMVRRGLEEHDRRRATWPRCPECGQAIKPREESPAHE